VYALLILGRSHKFYLCERPRKFLDKVFPDLWPLRVVGTLPENRTLTARDSPTGDSPYSHCGEQVCRFSWKIPRYCCQFQPELWMYGQILVKFPSTKFHENPFSHSPVAACVQTDGRSRFNRRSAGKRNTWISARSVMIGGGCNWHKIVDRWRTLVPGCCETLSPIKGGTCTD
jgi:hypothetical protein